jgi:hypothetical protein
MKTRKSIGYAYPTSPNAETLGMGKTGCWHLNVSVLREDGTWSPDSLPHNAEGYATSDDPDLIAQFIETEGEICPMFKRYGLIKATSALGLDQGGEALTCSVGSFEQALAKATGPA